MANHRCQCFKTYPLPGGLCQLRIGVTFWAFRYPCRPEGGRPSRTANKTRTIAAATANIDGAEFLSYTTERVDTLAAMPGPLE
jgi:hypothetical protein